MNYTRGTCNAVQDLRPLPDAKTLGPGPMPIAMVPLVFMVHAALLIAIGWFAVTFTIFKKTNEAYTVQMRAKTVADARSQQVRTDIEANTRARAFFSQHERLLQETTAVAPVVSRLMAALPANQKVVRVSLRRADDAREKGEMLLRVEMANEGPLTSQTLSAFQDELIRRGFSPSNLATRSDSRKNYIEGRITPKLSQ